MGYQAIDISVTGILVTGRLIFLLPEFWLPGS
jgi:hypothetical protein